MSEETDRELLEELQGIRKQLEAINAKLEENETKRDGSARGILMTILEMFGSFIFGIIVIGPLIAVLFAIGLLVMNWLS